jgi:hypothetical protein
VSDYYHDRQDKQLYIDENLYAQGYDKDAFLNMLAKEKGRLSSAHLFTMIKEQLVHV